MPRLESNRRLLHRAAQEAVAYSMSDLSARYEGDQSDLPAWCR
ncbi:hypothetical protein ACFVZD_46435 [Streptomyces sp. NPDC058287]